MREKGMGRTGVPKGRRRGPEEGDPKETGSGGAEGGRPEGSGLTEKRIALREVRTRRSSGAAPRSRPVPAAATFTLQRPLPGAARPVPVQPSPDRKTHV